MNARLVITTVAFVMLCGVCSPALALTCGTERWQQKVATDPESALVKEVPVEATISDLLHLPTPETLFPSGRSQPVETTLFRLRNVRLLKIELLADSDYRLTIADENGITMFANSPAPGCAAGSRFLGSIRSVYQAIGDLLARKAAKPVISITGVGFYDFVSDLPGEAGNGISLHPLLSLCAGYNCANGSKPVGASRTGKVATAVTPSPAPDDPAVTAYESVIQRAGANQFAELDEKSGTTITIDFTSATGAYLGGDILGYAPGPIVGSTSNVVRIPGGSTSTGASMPSANWTSGSSITLETWVHPTLQSHSITIWGTNGSRRLLIEPTGKLLSQLGGANYFSVGSLSNNAWSLVDFVYNATTRTASYYINGAFDSTSPTISTSAAQMSTYYLGQYDTSANYKFVGEIADVAVYPSALSGAQIAANHAAAFAAPPADDPAVMAYESKIRAGGAAQFAELDETTGPTVGIDFTAATGTYVGADVLSYAPGPIVGSTANVMFVPGGTASVGVSMPSANWTSGSSITLETWVRPTLQTHSITIWGADSLRRLIAGSTGKLLSQFGGTNYYSAGSLSNNAWSLVDFVYNATTRTASYYINGAFDSTSSTISTSAAHMSTYYLGQYDTSANYKFVGEIADVAVYPSALSGTQIAADYAAAFAATPPPPPTPIPNAVDWSTFGFDLYRTGYNPSETVLGATNIASVHPLWKIAATIGVNLISEPVLASNVVIAGAPMTVLYDGSEYGDEEYAINADTGQTVWTHPMGAAAHICGTSSPVLANYDTATIDRATNRLYVVDGQNQLHALDLSTGAEATGWPITVAADPTHNAVWSALTFNPANEYLYVETSAALCDQVPWLGRIVAVNTKTASIKGTFYPAQGNNGGGVWGSGGASVDPATNDVFIATANSTNSTGSTSGSNQRLGYSEQIVELSPDLSSVLANNYPSLPVVSDADFGATPLLFTPPGCPPLLAAINKSGVLVLYNRGNISAGPTQTIAMSIPTDAGDFIGTPAYDPVTHYLYVNLPSTYGIYLPGLGAFSMKSNCTLNATPVWNAVFGPDAATDPGADMPRSALTVANGVVYVSDFTGKTEHAFNASTGAQLWSTALKGLGFPGAIIANGRLYVSDYNGNIMAWGP